MSEDIREKISSSERSLDLTHTIDPGFVNQRRILTILGKEGQGLIDRLINALPSLPDWQKATRINHIYSNVMLEFCRIHKFHSLEEIVATRKGKLFCSTEELGPNDQVYDKPRGKNLWVPPGGRETKVEFHYSTAHITGDTMRTELYSGAKLSIIGELRSVTADTAIFHPLIMGTPWLESADPKWNPFAMWWGFDFYENVVEDFEEFSKVKTIPKPKDSVLMKDISERAFKECLAEIIGGVAPKDWGGEISDFYTAHLHLNTKRVSEAFVLKGPAKFAPMTLDTLEGVINFKLVFPPRSLTLR